MKNISCNNKIKVLLLGSGLQYPFDFYQQFYEAISLLINTYTGIDFILNPNLIGFGHSCIKAISKLSINNPDTSLTVTFLAKYDLSSTDFIICCVTPEKYNELIKLFAKNNISSINII